MSLRSYHFMEISTSIILVQPGMYVLRHSKNSAAPITVSRAPGGAGKIEILGTPETQNTLLRDGRDCLTMLVSEGPVELLVAGFMQGNEVVPAMKMDQIGLDSSVPQLKAASGSIQVPANGISIIGHFERLGDLVAAPGQTLGDPNHNTRLEGFQIEWPDHPEGIDLAYSIVIEGAGATPSFKRGNYCGTRGEARRITEVTIALVGPKASQFQLEGSAYFSGGFALPVTSGIPLGGPSGVEHLTALKLRAVPAAKKTANPWSESGQTKVFKAKDIAPTKTVAKEVAPKKTVAKKVAPTKTVTKK